MTKLFVKKPFLTLVTIVIVITIGIVSLTKMQTDLMPEMELPYLAVIVTDPGASPAEVEEEVTKPVESALGTVNGVENVQSTSSNNYGMVMLEFAEDSDMDSALVRVSQKLDTITFPEGCGTPNLMEIGMDMMASMYATVNYEGKDIKDLTTFSEKVVQPYLEKQTGVASVSTAGAVKSTVEIRLDQKKIDKINQKLKNYAQEKLDDAQAELDEGKSKISSGKAELSSQKSKLDQQQEKTNQELADANTQLDKAQANKAAYEANLNTLRANKEALNAEKKAYKDAKIEENYKTLNGVFSQLQTSLGGLASQAGVEIPSSIKDCVDHPEKWNAFQTWMGQIGAADQIASLNLETMEQLHSTVTVRLPQIDTALANLETEIIIAQTMVDQITKNLKDLDKTQSQALAGGYAAAEGFGAGQAQISAAQSQLGSAQEQIESAQKQLDDSKESALEHANIDALLSLDTLSQLIYAQNFAMPAGYVDDEKDNQWLVEVGEKYEDVDALKEMVLTKLDGVGTICISDVAEVVVVDNAGDTYAKVNGEDALMLSIFKSSTANTSEVTEGILQAFDELEEKYDGLSFTTMMDQGDYIDRIISSVLSSILMGAALAIVVLALFLRDVRPTVVVAFSIPFSVLFAIVLMYFSNITLNVMSLGGLCIGIGMLVDNSIVVMENIYRLRNMGYSAPKAAVYGAKQVAGPIIASTLTTVCVFLPMVYTTGIVSQIMIPFAFTISFALVASLLVALTVVPTLGSVLLRKPKEKKSAFFAKILDGYANVLAFCLKRKVIPLALAIVLLALCTARVFHTGLVMFDDMESNQISGTMTVDDETDKETAYKLADELMEKILTVDGVDRVGIMDGNSGAMSGVTGGSSADGYKSYSIFVVTKEDIKSTEEFHRIIQEIEAVTEDVKCEEFTVSSSAMGGVSMMSTGLQMNITGADQEQLIAISEDAMKMLEELGECQNITNGIDETNRQIHITLKKNELAKHGLTVATVYQQIAQKITTDQTAITLSMEDTDMDVDIVKGEGELLTYETLMDMKITATKQNADGTSEEKKYKLSKFAETQEGYAMDSITRKNQTRYLTVSAETKEGANATLLSRELQKKVDAYDVPDGYTLEIAGESEQVMEMMTQLMLTIALGCLLIYMIMVAQFQSLLSPFIILFTVPLAFTGGMIGLMIFGKSISAMSMLGFMILMGTVVNNGIVFVDYANQLRIKGVEKHTALIITGKTRMRPIIMTALTTILSMSVMVFSNDAGNAMQKGMAIVVCFGLIYSTLMTLFIVPVLYDIFYRREPKVIDVDDVDDIPDETEELLAEHGFEFGLDKF